MFVALEKRVTKSVRSLPLLYQGDDEFPAKTVTFVLGQSLLASLSTLGRARYSSSLKALNLEGRSIIIVRTPDWIHHIIIKFISTNIIGCSDDNVCIILTL